MGAAKHAGGLDAFYPDGDVTRANWDLVVAIEAAIQVLGWFEHPQDEQPPENIWHSPERIKEWFEAIRQKRRDEARGIRSIDPDEGAGADDYVDPEVRALRGS